MSNFDVSKEWAILVPPNIPEVKKAAGDLSRYIGLLASLIKSRYVKPVSASGVVPAIVATIAATIADASSEAPPGPVIVLDSDGGDPGRNGFSWRARPERVEIYGESGRGLCNGIYSFLSAMGISWPVPGEEEFPRPEAKDPQCFPLVVDSMNEPSRYEGTDPAAAPWRRFVPAGKKTVKNILKRSEAFIAWAARRRYDAVVFPLTVFGSDLGGGKLKQFKQAAGEYGIAIEAGGRDLSALVPRGYYFFHRDIFRMEEGARKKAYHFCPTNPATIRVIEKEGGKLFRSAGDIRVFHLWPDRGAETVWCSCPSCRAFSPSEQNRIGVNSAADVLAAVNPRASVTYFEKSGEGGNIPLRKNLFRMEKLPEEKECYGKG